MNNVLNIKLIEQLTAINNHISIESLCEQIYSNLKSQMDSLDHVIVFQQKDALYLPLVHQPRTLADQDLTSIASDDVPASIQNNEPEISQDQVLLAIQHNNTLLGFVQLTFAAQNEHDEIHWVVIQRLLSQQLAKHLSIQQTENDAKAQVLQEITVDKTFNDIAFSIARHLLPQKGRYVTINKIFYDETGNVSEWNVVASANRNKIMTEQVTTTFPWKSLRENTRQHLMAGKALHVTQDMVGEDEFSSGKIQTFFNEANIQALHNFPIVANELVIAVLTVVNRSEQSLTDKELETFTAICNQIGTVLYLRDRIEQTTAVQISLQTMVDASYQISLAEDDTEIGEILFTSMPNSVSHIALYRFADPVTSEDQLHSLTMRVLTSRDQIIASDEHVLLQSETFTADIIQKLLAGDFIVENDLNTPSNQLPTAFYNTLKSSPIQAFILTGLRVSQQLMGLVLIGTEKNITIDIDYHRNFRILADQVGITYENKRLLRRTEVSLMETQLQYAISNDLVQSKDLIDITWTLLRYFGDSADGAGIMDISYDNQGKIDNVTLTHQLDPQTEKVTSLKTSINDLLDDNVMHEIDTKWSEQDMPVYFIENTESDSSPLPLSVFAQQKIASCILIPLLENNRVHHLIALNWNVPQAFADRNRRLIQSIRGQLDIIYQNQQLLESAQVTSSRLSQQIQIQRALNDLATFSGTIQDEQLLLSKGAETLKQATNVDHIGIMLIDSSGETAYLASEYPQRAKEEIRIPAAGDIWDNLRRGESYTIKDVTLAEDNLTDSTGAMKAVQASSSMFIPFRDLAGKLIGSVGLDQDKGIIKLTEEQIQTARLINAQLVTQLQNLRLLQDSQTLATQMQQVARFGETVQSRLDLEEILQTSLHFIQRIFEADYIAITRYDEAIEKLLVQAYYLEGNENILPKTPIEMSADDTLVGSVWAQREPIYIADLQNTDYTNPISSSIRSVYGVALIARGVTRGVIEVGRTYNREIRPVEQSVLLQLANQLIVALENTNAYIQSQRTAQNKILANEIALQLQQQVDIDSLLNTTVTELGKALGAKRARIRLGIQQVAERE